MLNVVAIVDVFVADLAARRPQVCVLPRTLATFARRGERHSRPISSMVQRRQASLFAIFQSDLRWRGLRAALSGWGGGSRAAVEVAQQ